MSKKNDLRLFFAIALPLVLAKEALRRFQIEGRPELRWIPPERLHLTLRFLGDVSREQLPILAEAARNAVQETTPIPLAIEFSGVFPATGAPRVYWAGLESSGAERVCLLADRLNQALAIQGWPLETRVFTPHITLARIRRNSPVNQTKTIRLKSEINNQDLRWIAKDLLLIESQLGAHPFYKVIDQVSLHPGN